MKLDILAIGVHPDDVELSCSGTIAKHVAMGKAVGILDLSRGELGTRGNAELRTIEANNSAKILGVKIRTQLNFKDGFFENNEFHQKQIIEQIIVLMADQAINFLLNIQENTNEKSIYFSIIYKYMLFESINFRYRK